ncbi:MAG TPA: filamentous hemagglutinin N-terminal domain-containing protein [Anaerohalosphaeraceae bacterium]|nr:filamentous hemagglutinin N-terminal domain-containing protein [Anaerohalosphaeraceae bacterium]
MKTFAQSLSALTVRQATSALLIVCTLHLNIAQVRAMSGADPQTGNVSVGPIAAEGVTTVTVNAGTGSAKAVINWQDLNISDKQTLQFVRDGGAFVVLNRDLQSSATRIDGTILGNQGHIIVINQNGVVFGPTASVQAAKFTAGAMTISDQDFLTQDTLKFIVTDGAVKNLGTITAEQVALIGREVINRGIIQTPAGGFVLLASADEVYLAENQTSPVRVRLASAPETSALAVNEEGGKIEAPAGTIILAAGDLYVQALDDLKGLGASVQTETGRVGQFGTVSADAQEGDGGRIALTAGEAVVLGSESITSANAAENGDGGQVIVFSPQAALFSQDAQIRAKGGSESGDGGFVEVSGRQAIELWGHVDTTAVNGKTGTFLIDPSNIQIDSVTSPNMTWNGFQFFQNGTWSSTQHLSYAWIQNQLALSNVEITTHPGGTAAQQGWIWVRHSILWDTNTALTLNANSRIWIEAPITNSGSGAFSAVTDGLNAPGGSIYVRDDITAGSIRLNAGDPTLTTDIKSHVFIENGSNLTATEGNLEIAARENISIDGNLQANQGSVLIQADSDLLGFGDITASGTIDSAQNTELTGRNITVNQISAGGDIVLKGWEDVGYGGGVVTTTGDLNSASGNVDISIKTTPNIGGKFVESVNYDPDGLIRLGGNTYAAGDINLHNNTWVNGNGEQILLAGRTLQAEGFVRKCTAGDLWLIGLGFDELYRSINLLYDDYGPALSTHQGNLWVIGQYDIQVAGDVTTFGPDCCGWSPTPGCFYGVWPTGGVLLYSMTGRIYTDDLDGLNVNITGSSDHWGGLGIFNPLYYFNSDIQYEQFDRLAIAVISADDLVLGPSSSLNAFGRYYDDVDDRDSLLLVDGPAEIGGYDRNPGEPFDAAIYTASTDGNVQINMSTQIRSCQAMPALYALMVDEGPDGKVPVDESGTAKGAMVIDAYDTITFGTNFKNSLAGNGITSDVGGRLEVVSRITEWLSDAYGRLPYADPAEGEGPFPAGYNYVFRGAGLENPEITDGRAWVLEDPAAPAGEVAPLYRPEEPRLGGCPLEMDAAAAELGIHSDQLQVAIANSLALNPTLNPCSACAQLITAANILKDSERMTAVAAVFEQIAPADMPFTPEMGAAIASAFSQNAQTDSRYASAMEFVDAFVRYVTILDRQIQAPIGDPVTFALNRYGTSLLETGNSNITAYLLTQIQQ